MINFALAFFISKFFIFGWAIYYALLYIETNNKLYGVKLQKEMETFHIPPSLCRF